MTICRVIWGLGRSEDFDSYHEAAERADEIQRDLVEMWPILAGTNDAVLPRIVEVEQSQDTSRDTG